MIPRFNPFDRRNSGAKQFIIALSILYGLLVICAAFAMPVTKPSPSPSPSPSEFITDDWGDDHTGEAK